MKKTKANDHKHKRHITKRGKKANNHKHKGHITKRGKKANNHKHKGHISKRQGERKQMITNTMGILQNSEKKESK